MNNKDERKGLPSASGFSRIVACPKSWQLEKGLPDKETEYSQRGTFLHKKMSDYWKDGTQNIFNDITEEERAGLNYCITKTLEIIGDSKPEFRCCDNLRLEMKNSEGETIMTGQPDDIFALAGSNALHVIDYKFGFMPVDEASENKQMMCYALMAFDWIDPSDWYVDEVYVHIIQPFALGKHYSVARYTRESIRFLRGEIEAILKDADSDNAKYCDDIGAQCQYCKATSICERQKENVEILPVVIQEESQGFELITKENALHVFSQLEEWTAKKNQVEKYLEEIKSNLEKFVSENPDSDCGLEFKQGSKKMTFDTVKAYSAIQDVVSADTFIKFCKVEKTKLVEYLAKLSGISKAIAEEALIEACEANNAVSIEYNKPKLVIKKGE